MESLTSYFPIILTSMLVASCMSPLAIALSRRLGLVDVPGRSRHKQHASPTPLAGGIVLAAALAIAGLAFRWYEEGALVFLAGALPILVFGLLDDKRGLGVVGKLTGQILGAVVLVLGGTQVHLFGSDVLNLGVTLLWVIGVVNAFNFVDSMDGLALGLVGVAAAFFMLVTIDSGQFALASVSASLLGACVGAYYFNLQPARMFLGDAGSQLAGFLLAAIGVAYAPRNYVLAASWYVPILVLGVPIFDTALVVASRWRRRVKVYQAGLDHSYHRLRKLGLEASRSVHLMHVAGILLGLSAFIGLNAGALIGNMMFAAAIAGGLALIFVFERWAPSEPASDGGR